MQKIPSILYHLYTMNKNARIISICLKKLPEVWFLSFSGGMKKLWYRIGLGTNCRNQRILTTQNESTTNSVFFRSREKKLQFLRDDLRNASFCFGMFWSFDCLIIFTTFMRNIRWVNERILYSIMSPPSYYTGPPEIIW